MEELRESIKKACQKFDRSYIDKQTIVAKNIKTLAEAYAQIMESDVKAITADNAHEAKLLEIQEKTTSGEAQRLLESEKNKRDYDVKMLEIKERSTDNESRRILEDEKQTAEASAKVKELELREQELRAQRKKNISDFILSLAGNATSIGGTGLALWWHRRELIDILKFEKDDMIPISVGFNFWSKSKK